LPKGQSWLESRRIGVDARRTCPAHRGHRWNSVGTPRSGDQASALMCAKQYSSSTLWPAHQCHRKLVSPSRLELVIERTSSYVAGSPRGFMVGVHPVFVPRPMSVLNPIDSRWFCSLLAGTPRLSSHGQPSVLNDRDELRAHISNPISAWTGMGFLGKIPVAFLYSSGCRFRLSRRRNILVSERFRVFSSELASIPWTDSARSFWFLSRSIVVDGAPCRGRSCGRRSFCLAMAVQDRRPAWRSAGRGVQRRYRTALDVALTT